MRRALRAKTKGTKRDGDFKERDSLLATAEILADHDLTSRLLKIKTTIKVDVARGRLLRTEDVFGK
jgi:hypothetical protein